MATSEQPPKQLTCGDYTVGWICALPKEQTASIAMLDERHAKIEKPADDPNIYHLGSISNHNIVITCLPKGQIGTIEAGICAARMLITFSSIKIGLMVGIGGGVPSNKVRLGDVVIGTPSGEFPGVVQWDLGKIEVNGILKRSGALNNPPKTLLAAVSTLETQHQLEGSKIPQHLEQLRTRWPRLASKYCWSSSLTDSVATADDGHDYRKPEVHYGLIASGNRVIKDAEFRDNLNATLDGKVLAIEMEAAGLMNNFPCIVVRGICDYADCQKNDDWQEYAAAVAAACAKELLEVLEPRVVTIERPLKDILQLFQDNAIKVEAMITSVQSDVTLVKSKLNRQEDREIIEWLTPVDYSLQHQDSLRRRQDGTCQWLLQTIEYLNWVNRDNQILLCHGIPGAGKTILAATIIENLHERFHTDVSIGVAFIYGNLKRKEEQKLEDLLAALLRQLGQQDNESMECLRSLQNQHKKTRTRPSLKDISKILRKVSEGLSKVFIIVDALDELLGPNGFRDDRFLEELIDLQQVTNLSVLVTSRPLPDVMDQFKYYTRLKILAKNEDVQKYLDAEAYRLPKCVQTSPGLTEQVKTAILDSTQGMFLLAQLNLESMIGKVSVKAIRQAVKTLPTGSSEEVYVKAYENIMKRIVNQVKDQHHLAEKVLLWIIAAERLLGDSELQHLLAIDIGDTDLDRENLPDVESMVAVCAGLVTVERPGNIIRLVHYTARDYLDQTRERWLTSTKLSMARTCLTYLNFDGPQRVQHPGSWVINLVQERISIYPGYKYVSKFWDSHVRRDGVTNEEILNFLENQSAVQASWEVRISLSFDTPWPVFASDMFGVTGLILASYVGMHEVVDLLLKRGYDVDARGKDERTPLSYAAEKGHDKVVALLLKNGAQIDMVGENLLCEKYTPLCFAIRGGHFLVVQQLLRHGARVDNVGDNGPLATATKFGHEAITNLLLNRGASIEERDPFGRTPLSYASTDRSQASARILLAKGADIHSRDDIGMTTLVHAIKDKNPGLVELLLQNGADVNELDDEKRSPLLVSAARGNLETTSILLRWRAQVGSKDRLERTPLSYAADDGYHEVVQILLQHNAMVDSADNLGRTPLSYAAERGQLTVVEILLKHGADVNLEDASRQKPLSHAAQHGRYEVVRTLLETGAEPNSRDQRGLPAIAYAAMSGHEEVVQILLQHGAEANSELTRWRQLRVQQKSTTWQPPVWQNLEAPPSTGQLLLHENHAQVRQQNSSGNGYDDIYSESMYDQDEYYSAQTGDRWLY